jgi:predicted Na+-dependent transporter
VCICLRSELVFHFVDIGGNVDHECSKIIFTILVLILLMNIILSVAYAFQLNQYDALGMLLIGTCPGGSLSNLITYWCSGDVVLR